MYNSRQKTDAATATKRGMAAALFAMLFAALMLLGMSQAFAAGDDYGDAQKMTSGTTYHGTLKDMEGAQYYRFKTLGVTGVNYRIKASNSNTDAPSGTWALAVTVRDQANSNTVKVLHVNANGSGYVTLTGLKKSKTYYLVVQSEGGTLNYYNENYTLRCTNMVITPAKAKVKTLKGYTGKAKVTYGKVTYAGRYQVAYKNKGSSAWKIVNNGKKLSKTLTGLKKGAKYTVKVRAQRFVSGKAYSGKWSSAKTVAVKR